MKEVTAQNIHTPGEKLEVFLFNVGQGDHIMLKFPTLEYGIIDFYYDSSINITEPPCLSYFKQLKKELSTNDFNKITISFFCISHTDKDHIKGVCDSIRWFYENGIFIREFWFGAARDEAQLNNFLKIKINSIIDDLGLNERLIYQNNIALYNKSINNFFEYFGKWKAKEFKSERYSSEEIGSGEYLAEIRSLIRPCSMPNCHAINMGPLQSQLDDYINNLTWDIIKKILGVKIKDGTHFDKNHLSHILRIKFGDSNLLFGGDTHRDIWEECIRKYENSNFSYLADFGNYDSNFIKVSHHGSKNSSSSKIWGKIISLKGKVYLGISAGLHRGYNHPSIETIEEIRTARNDANILCTNICATCILTNGFEKEYHGWYDENVSGNYRYGKKEANLFDNEINEVFSKSTYSHSNNLNAKEMGLFAYIFEIPSDPSDEIKVRIALSTTNKNHVCNQEENCKKLI